MSTRLSAGAGDSLISQDWLRQDTDIDGSSAQLGGQISLLPLLSVLPQAWGLWAWEGKSHKAPGSWHQAGTLPLVVASDRLSSVTSLCHLGALLCSDPELTAVHRDCCNQIFWLFQETSQHQSPSSLWGFLCGLFAALAHADQPN